MATRAQTCQAPDSRTCDQLVTDRSSGNFAELGLTVAVDVRINEHVRATLAGFPGRGVIRNDEHILGLITPASQDQFGKFPPGLRVPADVSRHPTAAVRKAVQLVACGPTCQTGDQAVARDHGEPTRRPLTAGGDPAHRVVWRMRRQKWRTPDTHARTAECSVGWERSFDLASRFWPSGAFTGQRGSSRSANRADVPVLSQQNRKTTSWHYHHEDMNHPQTGQALDRSLRGCTLSLSLSMGLTTGDGPPMH